MLHFLFAAAGIKIPVACSKEAEARIPWSCFPSLTFPKDGPENTGRGILKYPILKFGAKCLVRRSSTSKGHRMTGRQKYAPKLSVNLPARSNSAASFFGAKICCETRTVCRCCVLSVQCRLDRRHVVLLIECFQCITGQHG